MGLGSSVSSAADRSALVSLFRGGAHPEVAMFEREVPLAALASTVGAAIAALHAKDLAGADGTRARASPHRARGRRHRTRAGSAASCARRGRTRGRSGAPFFGGAHASRATPPEKCERTVERADLLGLLVRGKLRIGVGDRIRTFGDTFAFLFAEQLLALATEVLEAWEQGRSYYRRVELFGIMLGIRFSSGGRSTSARGHGAARLRRFLAGRIRTVDLAFRGSPGRPSRRPHLPPRRCAGAARSDAWLSGARSLARSCGTTHRSGRICVSPRFAAGFVCSTNACARPPPTTPRSIPLPRSTAPLRRRLPRRRRISRPAAKLRFTPCWTATFPGIDLRATFLCGDGLIVGASRETACVEKRTGAFLWRRPTQPAVSVVTPAGLARLFPTEAWRCTTSTPVRSCSRRVFRRAWAVRWPAWS